MMQVFAQHLQAVPVSPSQRGPSAVPPDLEQLVLSCLAKAPEDRPQSAAELDRGLAAADVEPWTDVHAQQWWAATQPLAGDTDGNVDTHPGRHASGDSDTRIEIDLSETSAAPKRPAQP